MTAINSAASRAWTLFFFVKEKSGATVGLRGKQHWHTLRGEVGGKIKKALMFYQTTQDWTSVWGAGGEERPEKNKSYGNNE